MAYPLTCNLCGAVAGGLGLSISCRAAGGPGYNWVDFFFLSAEGIAYGLKLGGGWGLGEKVPSPKPCF